MADSEERQSGNGRWIGDADPADQISDGEDSVNVSSASANQSVARRLTEILVEGGDGDLLLQRSDREGGFLQWLRALDMQVMGACRADERLKPLLKLNVSTGVAEDRLLAHLNQHFEPAEVGMLARCLCIPLVSIRVGKINKEGTLLSPTSIRGNLCLTLLPTSDLRLSFNGDDGSMESLATLSTEDHSVEIEEISADKSGRSFLIKVFDSMVSYFWCSEKFMLLGKEMLRKMKDLLTRKPSLAKLSGISESRLSCFATHLRSYLAGSMLTSAQASGVLSPTPLADSVDSSRLCFPQSSFSCQKSTRLRQCGSQGSKTNLICQSSLSPRSSSFKEGLQRSSSSIRSTAREKLRRRGENYVSCIDSILFASSNAPAGSNCCQKDKLSEVKGTNSLSALNFFDVLGKSVELPLAPLSGHDIQISSSGPFSPHYCWCPPVASALQYTIGNPQLPLSSTEPLSLPPFSSLLSSARQPGLASKPLLDLAEIPSADFPSLPPEPVGRLPTSQQIPTFTPLICDPIVHIPVIDVCSSGQGYLVSAGTAMATTIPPLNPSLTDPLLPNAESVVEKGARETLRMLISSSNQPSSQLLEVLPSVVNGGNSEKNALVAGSRGLYSGSRDVGAITNSIPSMGFVLLPEKFVGVGIGKRCGSPDDLIDPNEKPPSSGPSNGFDEGIN